MKHFKDIFFLFLSFSLSFDLLVLIILFKKKKKKTSSTWIAFKFGKSEVFFLGFCES